MSWHLPHITAEYEERLLVYFFISLNAVIVIGSSVVIKMYPWVGLKTHQTDLTIAPN